VKKRQHAVFAAILVIFLFIYFQYNDFLKSFFFVQFQKTIPSKISTDKIVFISDNFALSDYNTLFDKLNTAENSVVLFLPQIFNIKVGDYLENIDPGEIKKIKDDYRVFTLKLAEMKNIIPVAFLSRTKKKEETVALSQFSYFKGKKINLNLPEYNYLKVKSRRIWLTVQNVGFYRDYDYYPYTIPMLFRYEKHILVNAALEGIRRYYRFTKSSVRFEKGWLRMGKIINFPVTGSGEIVVHQIKKMPKIYSLSEILKMHPQKLADKIIIVRSMNNSMNTMISLGVTLSSILKGEYITYYKKLNYVFGAIIFLLLAGVFLNVRLKYGAIIFSAFEVILAGAVHLLLRSNVYVDFTMFSAINILLFTSIYFYRVSTQMLTRMQRGEVLSKFMHPSEISRFISNNRDIQVKNTWLNTYIIYFTFDTAFSENAENVKKTFEKIREIIYNNEKEFLIKLHSNHDIAVILLKEGVKLKGIFSSLFEIRNTVREPSFNIVFSSTETYIYEFNKDMVFTDKNAALKIKADQIEKKKYIIVPEKDIQKYINIIKFQKITNVEKEVLFNVVGVREEA